MRDGEDACGLIVSRGADLEEAVRERCLGERQALPEAMAPDDDEVRPTVAHTSQKAASHSVNSFFGGVWRVLAMGSCM